MHKEGKFKASLETDVAKDLLQLVDAVTRSTLESGFNLVQKYRLAKELKLLKWIEYDKHFIPGTLDQRFKQWIPKDGNVVSFQELKQNYTLNNEEHIGYFQLRDFMSEK